MRDSEPLEHWARFKFDENLKCDDNTNNFVESFNFVIVKHWGKPVYTLLEEIKKLIVSRFYKRYQIATTWTSKVTSFVLDKLAKIEIESRACTRVVQANSQEFDVEEDTTIFTIRLQDHYCNYRKWQISGIPCKHATRCILRNIEDLQDYCSHWFTVDYYKKMYDNILHPIPDSTMWEPTDLPQLDPPFECKRSGRPPKNKRRESVF